MGRNVRRCEVGNAVCEWLVRVARECPYGHARAVLPIRTRGLVSTRPAPNPPLLLGSLRYRPETADRRARVTGLRRFRRFRRRE